MRNSVGAITLPKRNLVVHFGVDPPPLFRSHLGGSDRRMRVQVLSKTSCRVSPSAWIIVNFSRSNIAVHVVGVESKAFHYTSKQSHLRENQRFVLYQVCRGDTSTAEDTVQSFQPFGVPILEKEDETTSNVLIAGSTDREDDIDLRSTWRHGLWVGFGFSILAAMAVKAIREVDSAGEAAAALMASALAYWLADLGTGIYHWAIDNYGDENSLLFGSQIKAFQGHHERPWTITKRAFANNLHALARPAGLLLLSAICADPSCTNHASLDAFVDVFTAFVVFSQQFHAWLHMKKSNVPFLVMLLQDRGLLVSPKMHGQHHRPPFNCNYCIVSGIWNPLLDSTGLFQKLERIIYTTWKIAPRSWTEPTPRQEAPYIDYLSLGSEVGMTTTKINKRVSFYYVTKRSTRRSHF